MKQFLLMALICVVAILRTNAQGVTQINANKSLQVDLPLSANKTFLHSVLDSSIWITDGTAAGTLPLSATIKFDDDFGLLNGKIIFRGSTPATGSELYISDGTTAGTKLVSDINPGVAGSGPSGFALLGSFLYFTAETPAAGRELWRTNGTPAGTTLVKDIMPGTGSSFNLDPNLSSTIFSNGSYLLFAANTAAGNELWKSDGSATGTVLLKDINTGNSGADSSNPDNFIVLNTIVLFTATDATHGNEIWKTDGSAAGTVLVKDINAGTASATEVEIFPGFFSTFFFGFHIFKNHAYFNANDGKSAGEIWVTDGTSANTTLVKDFPYSSPNFSWPLVTDAVNFSDKFIFPYGDGVSRSELWQSNGTPTGTVLLKSFSPTTPGTAPAIFIPFNIDFVNQTFNETLFQGNKFFFAAGTSTQGTELWSSDGTVAGTKIVEDINPGVPDGIDFSVGDGSYLYTSSQFFFGANDATHGSELWQTDGTTTSMVKDLNPGAGNANPELSFFVANGKVLFGATDGSPADESVRDLYVVGGSYSPLPVKLTNFTVAPQNNDALLQWTTREELNSKSFIIQRSYDAQHFEDIGSLDAKGTTNEISNYSFVDRGIMNSGRRIVYYRLNALDKDLKSALSDVIALKINSTGNWSIRLLSNPVKDFVNLLLQDVSGRLQLSVRDIYGRVVYSKSMDNINGQISLPAPTQAGIYILEAENNNERKIVRFVK